jgi:hypothetical protein
MFLHLNDDSRRSLVSFCCGGAHCHGDKPEPVFYNFVPAVDDIDGKVVVWLKLGRDEQYVMDSERPGNEDGQWRVIEELREK